ncbi:MULTISPECIES: acyltransferase [unclassified Crossiella]|uniref:acyltransferase family protein n=1 Tax=unclassified Crossiella TaxID=2620835 RepID=UPI0027E52B74|nr:MULTISPECIES: acyltransferase [unclassified Crossiella]
MKANGQLPSLTGLRWVAALIVFLYHVRNFGYFDGPAGGVLHWAFDAGATGVSFFFILSGFVLAWSVRPGEPVTTFWRRRFARIYPVHLVTAVLALALGATLVPGLLPSSGNETAANLLLISSWWPDWWQALNPVSWSLVCEAFFYLCFPLLFVLLRKGSAAWLYAVAAAAVLVVLALPFLGLALYSFPLARLPEFVLGVALGLLVRNGWWRGPALDLAVAVTLVGYFLTAQVPGDFRFAACTVLGFALLLPAAAMADLTGTQSIWRHPRLVVLGEWSFSFYMIHLLVLRLAEMVLGTAPRLPFWWALAAFTVVFTVSLLLSWLLYEQVEKPARRLLLRRWSTPRLKAVRV